MFNPSLIWLPFGKRAPDDITFPVAPTFENHDVDFVHAPATELLLDQQQVLRLQHHDTRGGHQGR